MIADTVKIEWPERAEPLYDRLISLGITDPDTGDDFTVARIDRAIRSALEDWADVEGHRSLPDYLSEHLWWSLEESVLLSLDLEWDEVWQVIE